MSRLKLRGCFLEIQTTADKNANNGVNSEVSEKDAFTNVDVRTLKDMVTPDAFIVDKGLYGLALARPWRRAGAILLDLLLIAILADQNVLFLAVVAAATFIKVGKDYQGVKRFRRTRRFLRFMAMLVLALVIYQSINPSYQQYVEPMLSEQNAEQDKQQKANEASVTEISSAEQSPSEQVTTEQVTAEQVAIKQQVADKVSEVKQTVTTKQQEAAQVAADNATGDDQPEPPKASLTDWVTGFITTDLGFGFGWAAFYFSVFTAWWQGQTPGKRLFGIRVIQLDGTPLSLWASFGRYGGYGAGFATGLLGFAQVYWDPNRQAIQDKISSTVVVRADLQRMVENTLK